MKKYIVLLFSLIVLSFSVNSQNADDALNFSQLYTGGTARFISMGGAFGALGGDLSALSTNPATIGIYRSSEFTFTPGLFFSKTESDYLGNKLSDSKFNLNLNNIGYVWTIDMGKDADWANINFGMAYNRLNNFHRNYQYEGVDDNTSIVDMWFNDGVREDFVNAANKGENYAWNDFGNGLAYDAYLINEKQYFDNNGDTTYGIISDFNFFRHVNDTLQYDNNGFIYLDNAHGTVQRLNVEERGHTGEYAFSMGANFTHKFYIGATMGIQHIHNEKTSIYQEVDINHEIDNFNSLIFKDFVETSGTGINLKIGGIYRPNDYFRLGFAFHTPTSYAMKDQYYSELASNTEEYGNKSAKSPEGVYEYTFRSPYRALMSLGIVIKKRALIGVEYEFVDYTSAKLNSADDSFFGENSDIRSTARAVGNLKAGLEININSVKIRGGYAFYPSPYKVNELNEKANRQDISAGFGVREDNFFFDFAFQHSFYETKETPYGYQDVNTATINNKFNQYTATVGFKF